jgi:hypothetical protein
MFSVRREKLKIFNLIVLSILVLVMNNFMVVKVAAEVLFHHKPMLGNTGIAPCPPGMIEWTIHEHVTILTQTFLTNPAWVSVATFRHLKLSANTNAPLLKVEANTTLIRAKETGNL